MDKNPKYTIGFREHMSETLGEEFDQKYSDYQVEDAVDYKKRKKQSERVRMLKRDRMRRRGY